MSNLQIAKELSDKILATQLKENIKFIAISGPLSRTSDQILHSKYLGKNVRQDVIVEPHTIDKLLPIIFLENNCELDAKRYSKEGCQITKILRQFKQVNDNSKSFLCNCWEPGVLDDLFMGGNLGPGSAYYELLNNALPIYEKIPGEFERLRLVFSQQKGCHSLEGYSGSYPSLTLEEFSSYIASRIKPLFKLENSQDPKLEFMTPEYEPFCKYSPAFFGYEIGKDEASILVSKKWHDEQKNNVKEIGLWLSEETGHYYHHAVNRQLFDETAQIENAQNAGTWNNGNSRILELKNLSELVARLAAGYTTFIHGDVEELRLTFNLLHAEAKEAGVFTGEQLDEFCKKNPEYAKKLYHVTNRIHGCVLAEEIITDSIKYKLSLPKPELVHALAKCRSFKEAAEAYESVCPERKNIIKEISDSYFKKSQPT